MNDISLDLSNPDLAPLKDKQPGDECQLDSVTLKVTSNDGKTLEGTITDLELGSDEQSNDEGGEGDMPMKDEGMGDTGEHKPIAVIAIGMKKK